MILDAFGRPVRRWGWLSPLKVARAFVAGDAAAAANRRAAAVRASVVPESAERVGDVVTVRLPRLWLRR